MKIIIKNLGALKQAEFTLGDLTIICGKNNTGKTYATYALFGFLHFWRESFSIKISNEDVLSLLNDGSIELDIQNYVNNAKDILKDGCDQYSKRLPFVFASPEKYFTDSKFCIDLKS